MNWITDLLTSFAHSLGMEHIPIGENGHTALEFENGRQLHLNAAETDITISLIQQSNGYSLLNELKTMLKLCHYENILDHIVKPGLSGDDTLSISIKIPQEQAVLSELESAIEQLQSIMDKVMEQDL